MDTGGFASVGPESALVILVPEAEAVAGPWRARLDPSAIEGLPAHVTILYPFAPPTDLDPELLHAVTELFGGFGPFDYELDEVRWFGEDVVWLSPQPVAPFRRLLELAYGRWPQYPPYGRSDLEPTPHVTVANRGTPAEMRAAAEAIGAALPIRARATEVSLLATRADSRWEQVGSFSL